MARRPLDRSMEPYYERRAAEYDDWYLGMGLFAERDRPGWDEDVRALIEAVASLPPVHTVDVACGTGFLTKHLPGSVVGVDVSAAMLAGSRTRHSHRLVRADAFAMPFRDASFDRLSRVTSTGTSSRSSARGSWTRAGGRRRSSSSSTRRSIPTCAPSRCRSAS